MSVGRQRMRPRGRFSTGLTQDPFAQFDDCSAFLRQRNEGDGRYIAAIGMVPADQRLKSGDFASDLKQGLIMERQFASGESLLQILPQGVALP